MAAIEEAVPAEVLSAVLYTRFHSRYGVWPVRDVQVDGRPAIIMTEPRFNPKATFLKERAWQKGGEGGKGQTAAAIQADGGFKGKKGLALPKSVQTDSLTSARPLSGGCRGISEFRNRSEPAQSGRECRTARMSARSHWIRGDFLMKI